MAVQYSGPGNWLGLPELNLTETFLGGNKNSVKNASDTYNIQQGVSPQTVYGNSTQLTPYALSKLKSPAVAGASTSSASNNYTSLMKTGSNAVSDNRNYAQQIEKERQAQEAEARKKLISATKKSYDPFFSELTRQEGEIPGIQNEMLGNVDMGYRNQSDVINRGQEAGIRQADAAAGEIKQNQATSLRDLGLNLGNAVSAFGQKLGAMGAGNSSAANMANFAYSKIANRNTADVMNQTRQKLAEVENTKQTIVTDAQDKLSALETWKSEQSLAVSNYVRSLRDYIAKAKSQGKMALAENEVASIRDGFNRAMAIAEQINNVATQSRAAILQNAQQGLASAQETAAQLNNMGDINVQAPTQRAIDNGTIAGQSGGVTPILGQAGDNETTKSLWDTLLSTGAVGVAGLPFR